MTSSAAAYQPPGASAARRRRIRRARGATASVVRASSPRVADEALQQPERLERAPVARRRCGRSRTPARPQVAAAKPRPASAPSAPSRSASAKSGVRQPMWTCNWSCERASRRIDAERDALVAGRLRRRASAAPPRRARNSSARRGPGAAGPPGRRWRGSGVRIVSGRPIGGRSTAKPRSRPPARFTSRQGSGEPIVVLSSAQTRTTCQQGVRLAMSVA